MKKNHSLKKISYLPRITPILAPITNNKIGDLSIQRRKTRKNQYLHRNTKKKRFSYISKKGGASDQTLYFVSSESPSRPGYPITRVISTEGDGEGGFMAFEQYLSDLTYDIEDQLLAIKYNSVNKKIPKRAIVKKFVIRKPIYLPNVF